MRWGGVADNEIRVVALQRNVISARQYRLPVPAHCAAGTQFVQRRPGESGVDCHVIFRRGRRMEFTLLFLAVAIVMLAAWRGSRPLALGLYAAVMIACVATYLHHATDTLKLSF
jgi:hypothetical protein